MGIQPRFGFALEYVKDVEAAKRFYVGTLGLKVEREHPTFVQFDHFAVASDESIGGRNEPELYWLVDDAEAALREVSPKAKVVVPLRQMPFGKVFAVQDTAGRPRFMVELARDRPSRPVA
jgi:catechol 2,3-dioxygenase-like lactoylglutathione lyase family enzyme